MTPANIYIRDIEATIAKVIVGTAPDQPPFYLYADVFRTISPWFEYHLKARRYGDPIKLEKDSPVTFNHIMTWVYGVNFSGFGKLPRIVDDPSEVLIVDASEVDLRNVPDIAAPDVAAPDVDAPDVDAPDVPTPIKPEIAAPVIKTEEVAAAAAAAAAPPKSPDTATAREMIDIYILAEKFEIPALKNEVMDRLYDWFHPDAPKKGGKFNSCKHADPGIVEGLAQPKPRYRRYPALRDVQHAFKETKPACSLRTLLVTTAAFYVFSERPQGQALPAEWDEVLGEDAQIGRALLRTIAKWSWVMGADGVRRCPQMAVRSKCSFHERTDLPRAPIIWERETVRVDDDDGNDAPRGRRARGLGRKRPRQEAAEVEE